MPLTQKEELIYNSYLVASRSVKGKPFRLRQDFSKIDSTTELVLKKLSFFFNNNSNVNITDFFVAPYKFYGADNYFDLQFFLTQKAVKCYSLFCKQRELLNPDNQQVIDFSKKCCSFIFKFCKENNLTLQMYKTMNNGTTPIVLQHLRDHKINFYVYHALCGDSIVRQVEPDLLNFFIKDFTNLVNETRVKFAQSHKLKNILREALSIVENKLLIYHTQ